MKKIMMTLFAIAIATTATIAQEAKQPAPPKKTPEERAEHITQRMTKTLALDSAQQQKIKALVLKRETERDGLEKKAKEGRQKMEAEMETDLRKILNAEQFEKFKKKKEEMKKKRMEKQGVPHPNESDLLPPPAPPEK